MVCVTPSMIDEFLTDWLRWLGGRPCFRIYGKGRRESAWRVIDVYASPRRNFTSRWPLSRGTCITWTAEVIAVGCDFARDVLGEQKTCPASRHYPVEVAAGCIGDLFRRADAGTPCIATASEVMAHEC